MFQPQRKKQKKTNPLSHPNVYITVVVALAELFVLFGSNVDELTLAVSLILLPEAAVTLTIRVSVTLAPLSRLSSVQTTTPVPPGVSEVQEPLLTPTLLKVVPTGTESLMVTLLAVSGPKLVA